jgi:hypothetical protein
MRKNIIAIRDVDEEILRKFRAKTIEENMKMGEALTLAMKRWIEERKKRRVNPKYLLEVKPFDWGKGSERTSVEIDEILYGRKR